ncbi:Nucleoside diphosphate kinase B [Dissostichus eleginoides]|uniref:Nucleoside diphosphate kinase B n=1 Tax=Dissostichus eleginoides TaxID=100907 RepID=A0AAD9EYR0_DISEL|nr:Nucleoside diphosphate kinase B [Dissostichus eleginoides]
MESCQGITGSKKDHVFILLKGSLLLLGNNYASSPVKDFIPHTALGILLLIIAVLLAYAGICRSLSHAQLFSSVCLTVSALWCGSGLVHILVGQGVLQPSELRASLVPGLAAFTLALLVIGGVAIAVKKAVLFITSCQTFTFLKPHRLTVLHHFLILNYLH